jgi:hypothetical protein
VTDDELPLLPARYLKQLVEQVFNLPAEEVASNAAEAEGGLDACFAVNVVFGDRAGR